MASINSPCRAEAREEQLTAAVEDDRLTIAGEGMGLVFDRED